MLLSNRCWRQWCYVLTDIVHSLYCSFVVLPNSQTQLLEV